LCFLHANAYHRIIIVQTSALRIGFSSFNASVIISASTKMARPVCSTHVFNVCVAFCRTLGCKHTISLTHACTMMQGIHTPHRALQNKQITLITPALGQCHVLFSCRGLSTTKVSLEKHLKTEYSVSIFNIHLLTCKLQHQFHRHCLSGLQKVQNHTSLPQVEKQYDVCIALIYNRATSHWQLVAV